MKLLLDTHIFLWYLSADSRLSVKYQSTIQDPTNEVYLSVASVWEAVIKQALGKLTLPAPAEVFLPEQRNRHQIASLAIDEATIAHLAQLPPIHRDPFDRILMAHALQLELTLLTVDDAIRSYPVPILPV
jgi:PIN domain nuclease of toxin-antitoxin system